MSEIDPPLGEVTIHYHAADDVRLVPPTGRINRVHQQITWTLVNLSTDETVAFSRPSADSPAGIFFPWPINPPPPPPPGGASYTKWPGQPPSGDLNVYTGDAMSPVVGNEPVFYLYYIALDTAQGKVIIRQGKHPITLELIDPPVENEPKP